MSKTRKCKIIPAQITDVVDGSYILNLPDGEQYKVEGGDVPLKRGSLIRFDKDSFFKLTNDVVLEDFEEITVLKEEPADADTHDTDFSSNNKEKNFAVWQDAPTRMLLDLYKEFRPGVNSQKFKTLKNMWEAIADRMQEEGYVFDCQQVESKWKSLVRSYRTGLASGMKRKSNYLGASFEREIGEILSSQGISFEVVNEDDNEDTDGDIYNAYESMPNKKRKSNNNSEDNTAGTSASDMTLLIKAINRRTSQKENADQIKQDQRERLISAIKERNEILKKYFYRKIIDSRKYLFLMNNHEVLLTNIVFILFVFILNSVGVDSHYCV
ncbi:hypothetical protein HHI36_003048 [Cryptolaemus montrouzieri]|uniref:Myb/SANT-like DNA-binding domain-containing protein n=1 Tax=Cryptolaemus montrouzieri TaxID=559131 RepID=A0ABD2PCU0_9CUCU